MTLRFASHIALVGAVQELIHAEVDFKTNIKELQIEIIDVESIPEETADWLEAVALE